MLGIITPAQIKDGLLRADGWFSAVKGLTKYSIIREDQSHQSFGSVMEIMILFLLPASSRSLQPGR